MNKTIIIILTILAVIATAFVVGKKKSISDDVGNTKEVAVNENASIASVDDELAKSVSNQTDSKVENSNIKEFVVEGSNFKFLPNKIKVKRGDKVRITFKNTGGYHDFNIDEFNLKTQIINTDQQETVEFMANKSGEFEYYCSVGNHRDLGMTGRLIVE